MAQRLPVIACGLVALSLLTAEGSATGEPARIQTSIRGATQMFATPWGLAAQGSGQLRILPLGTSKWQTVHQVAGDSLYRIAFDDGGRLLAWWEKEPQFHLFAPGAKVHETFALPPPPSPEFKYGYGIEDMYFTKGGDGAIVYMHGFIGGRTWVTVAYHYDLARRTAPTLLFRQPGYVLHTSARMAVLALPKKPDDACENNFCHPLGAVIAWEISGTQATRRVLLDGNARREDFSRVQPVWGRDGEQVACWSTSTRSAATSCDGGGAIRRPRSRPCRLPRSRFPTPRPCGSRPRATWSSSGRPSSAASRSGDIPRTAR